MIVRVLFAIFIVENWEVNQVDMHVFLNGDLSEEV